MLLTVLFVLTGVVGAIVLGIEIRDVLGRRRRQHEERDRHARRD
jgi:hypothetical protein